MNKTLIIIGREFTTRVRKRSFLVLTLVVPILLAGFYVDASERRHTGP